MSAPRRYSILQSLSNIPATLILKTKRSFGISGNINTSSSNRWTLISTIFVPSLIIIFSAVGWTVITSTQIYLMEQSLCRTYYLEHDPSIVKSDGSVPEDMCKFSELQADLSELSGWYDFFMSLPGLFVTVTFTKLATRIGEKKISILTAITFACQAWYFTAVCYFYNFFNIKMIWLLGFFDLAGGGWIVQQGLLYTTISKGVGTDQLSDFLFAISALRMGLNFLGLSMSALLLERHVWYLSIMGNILCTIVIPIALFLPSRTGFQAIAGNEGADENSVRLLSVPGRIAGDRRYKHDDTDDDDDDDDDDDGDGDDDEQMVDVSISKKPSPNFIVFIFSSITTDFQESIRTLYNLFVTDKFTRLCNLANLLVFNGYFVNRIFRQWVAKFFNDWTLADANAIASLTMILSAIVLVILPWLSRVVLKPRLKSSRAADLLVTKVSIALMAAGCSVVSVAPPSKTWHIVGSALYAFGYGYFDAFRGYATSFLVGDEEAMQLYNMSVGLVEVIAALVSAPLWGLTFAFVLRVEWLNVGIPVWMAVVSILAGLVFLYSLDSYARRKGLGRLGRMDSRI